MILLKDVYGVPVLLEDDDDELMVVVDHFGTYKKVRLKKNVPNMISVLIEKIENGVVSAEDILMFFSPDFSP